MPGLRLTRFVGQFGAVDFPGGRPVDAVWPEVRADVRGKLSNLSHTRCAIHCRSAQADLSRSDVSMRPTGSTEPTPIATLASRSRSPNWSGCGRPVTSAMADLAAEITHAIGFGGILSRSCAPSDPCRALDDRGRPQVFDGDHLSGHGNDMLYAQPARRDPRPGKRRWCVDHLFQCRSRDEGRLEKIQVR